MDTEKQKKTISVLYIFLIASTILGCVPDMYCVLLSLVLFLTVLIAAYWYRFRDEEDGLLFNHMTYLIGTIWIGSTFLCIGMVAAAYLVYENGDQTIIQSIIDKLSNGIMMTESELTAMFMEYVMVNQNLILAPVVPALLYLVYRIANGFARGAKGYRIANPRSWL